MGAIEESAGDSEQANPTPLPVKQKNWEVFMHWNAGVTDLHNLYVLFELSGRLLEIELVERQLPVDIDLSLSKITAQAEDMLTEEPTGDVDQAEIAPLPATEEVDVTKTDDVLVDQG